MTLQEWFWLVKFKTDQIEAEREAMEQAQSGHKKIHVPESVWQEMRAEHAAKMKAKNDGG